jgi:tRNA(Ile)-lysidine synthase
LGFGIWELTNTALYQRVRKTIERHALCPPGSHLLIGLSGGSDSVALLFLLRELAEHGGFTVAGLAHLNHQLRPTAERDEVFCRELARRLGLRIVVKSENVKGYARGRNLSVEDAARRVRYDFMGKAADTLGAEHIAVGHTQDDQAETFLLKLIRGAGLTGLAGIHPRRGRIIRPLLDVSRADLRSYLTARGERWIEDESNDDLMNPRNRIRHVVLPELDCAASGPTRPAIARAAGLTREDAEWLDELATRRYEALADEGPDGVTLEASALLAEPPPLRRRVLLKALRTGAGHHEIGLDHVEAAMAALAGAAGGVDIPGGRVELRRGKLVLIQQKPLPK